MTLYPQCHVKWPPSVCFVDTLCCLVIRHFMVAVATHVAGTKVNIVASARIC